VVDSFTGLPTITHHFLPLSLIQILPTI